MTTPDPIQELTGEIRKLLERVDASRRKDVWDRIPILTPLLSSVALAGLALFFTQSAQRSEAERQREFQEGQLAVQRAQLQLEELKALTTVGPMLASHDSAERDVAFTILDAVKSSVALRTSAMELGLIDSFAQQALDARQSDARRIAALRQLQTVATRSGTPGDRTRALGVARRVASTPGVSDPVRRTASAVAAGIQNAPPAPPPPAPASSEGDGNDEVAQVARLVNEHRKRIGCPPLAWDASAASAAQGYSEAMLGDGPFVTYSWIGGSVGDRLHGAGASWRAVAENIAAGGATAATVVQGWLSRPGHRANLDNCAYTRQGVGHAGEMWTQVLYTPL